MNEYDKKLCALLLVCSLATGLSGCGNKTTDTDSASSADDSKTGESVNLSYDMLLSSIWVNTETGDRWPIEWRR